MSQGKRWTDLRVGVFVLVALVLLVAGSLWIAGSGVFRPAGESYTVVIEDSAGLRPGDRVRVAGVPVGRIRAVELRPGEAKPVRMRVSIRPDIALHADSSAAIATEGLLGMPYLQIDPGSVDAPALELGGTIQGGAAAGLNEAFAAVGDLSGDAKALVAEATRLLETVSTEITPVLDGLERMLSEQNADHVSELLATMNETVGQAGPRVGMLMERLDGLTAQAEAELAALPELTAKLSDLVDGLHTALGTDGERVAGLLETATDAFDSANLALSSVAVNRHDLEATLADLRQTTANLESFTQLLNERPYSLVRMKLPADRKPGGEK